MGAYANGDSGSDDRGQSEGERVTSEKIPEVHEEVVKGQSAIHVRSCPEELTNGQKTEFSGRHFIAPQSHFVDAGQTHKQT
jgi:hypothetical protein